MNPDIWLMRHGDYDAQSGALTPTGIAQVQEASQLFDGKTLAIYHSPALRCVQTVEILKARISRVEVLKSVLWLDKHWPIPKDFLFELKGETIVLVSHQPTLYRIIEQFGYDSDKFSFPFGLPVKLVPQLSFWS